MKERIITASNGEKFRIVEDRAILLWDDDCYYSLPKDNMTDDELQEFFDEIIEFEK
jgi:hypothetical protein